MVVYYADTGIASFGLSRTVLARQARAFQHGCDEDRAEGERPSSLCTNLIVLSTLVIGSPTDGSNCLT
jgi:hypothetical protein